MNTGKLQAPVTYKVRAWDSAPLDIYDVLISESGRKQAIFLLTGVPNPNPALYEVEGYYSENGDVEGVPTTKDYDSCLTGFLTLSQLSVAIDIANPSVTLLLNSSHPWTHTNNAIATITPVGGTSGYYSVIITRTATLGEADIVFTNTHGETVTLHIFNTDVIAWVLATGNWNMTGVWMDASLWQSN